MNKEKTLFLIEKFCIAGIGFLCFILTAVFAYHEYITYSLLAAIGGILILIDLDIMCIRGKLKLHH